MLNVIIPAHNASLYLEKCLRALNKAGVAADQIYLCDDGSRDSTSAIGSAFGVHVIPHDQQSGAAAARNRGIRAVHGDILVFVDADVVVSPNAIALLDERLRCDDGLSAVFGAYDDSPDNQSWISSYRNLMHHYVHLQGAGDTHSFWTGLGAVRRTAAIAVGGFDEALVAMEDVEFGMRLCAHGHRICLDPLIQGKHLKKWTFWSTVRTDIFYRALPWSRLILARKAVTNELNLQISQRIAVFFACLAVLCLVLGFLQPVFFVPGAAALVVSWVSNIGFTRFLARKKGFAFAVTTLPLQIMYCLCAAVGLSLALFESILPIKPQSPVLLGPVDAQ